MFKKRIELMETKNIFQLHILALFSLWVIFSSFANAARKEAQDWVYSSQYDKMHKITDPQGMYNNIKVAKLGKLVFIAAGDSGIKVVDPDKDYNITYIFNKTKDYVEGFAISKNADYIFMPFDKKMTIFDFSSRKEFVQIGQDSVEIENVDMIINDDESIVYILQANGKVRAVNVSNKSAPKYAGEVTWKPSQIYGGLLSTDDNWLLICQDFQGLGIFKITENLDGTVTFTEAGSFGRVPGKEAGSQAVDITTNMKYVVNLDNRKGVYIGDFELITKAGSFSPPIEADYLVEYWPTDITLPAPYSLCISDDDKFLFLGVLAQGVFIVDIQNKLKPFLYQTIIIPFHGMSIKLSFDESDLYYANAESFYVFPKIEPNLNEQYVNLFNDHLSYGYDKSSTYYYWRCYIDDAKKYYYGAFDDDGLWIIDVADPQNMNYILSSFKPDTSTGDIDSIMFLNGFDIMILPVVDGTNVIAVYDIKNLPSTQILKADNKNNFDTPRLKQKVPFVTTNYIVDFDISQNILVGALGDSVIFFDITNPIAITVKKSWPFEAGMKGDCTGVMITNDCNYLIGASRGYGYFILDIKDLNNIKKVEYIDSLGAENMTAATSNDYCFFIDGLRGIMIMDLTKLPKISVISQIQVPGWSNDITFLNNEKLMLVSTLEKSMVTMVDISDIKNPFLVTEYLYENQNGMSSCAFGDNSYIFINNNIGVRALPTEGDVVMHVEVQQIVDFDDELDEFVYKKLDIEEIFKVGVTLQLDLVFLYQPLDLIIDKLIFYQTQTKFNLPDWIQFDPDELSIKINVVKEAIDPTNGSEPLLNVIIIKTINPLYLDDFTFSAPGCTTYDINGVDVYGKDIYAYVLENGILDDQNIVDPELELPDKKNFFIFGSESQAFNDCISKNLKFTLLNSIQYTPIYLFMQSSLILNLAPQDQNSYIETVAKQISINLLIPKFSGQFIFENQAGVDISINEEKNDFDVSGSVENVNDFLQDKIILYPIPPQLFAEIKIKITIQDKVNYDIEKTLNATLVSFVSEKQNIMINQNITLQDQLSEDYADSEIEIISDFLFQFDEDTFVSPDVDVVTYTALIKDGSDFVTIESNFWLKFNPEGFKFFGNPPQNVFNDVLTIQLKGFDGYTTVTDTFEIKVKKLPILFVIQWIAQILGPIIGVLGFYKYRHIYYNAVFKRKNRYSKIVCQVGEKFVLKIPLISTERRQAKDMIEELFAQIQKNEGNGGKKQDLKKMAKMNSLKLEEVENEEAIIKEEEKQERIAMREQDDIEGVVQKGDKESNLHGATTKDQTIPQALHHQRLANTDRNDITNQFKDKISKAKPYVKYSIMEKKYVTQDGKINMKQIVDDMLKYNIQFKLMGKMLEAKAYKEELNNRNCTLYKCIKLLIARYLISLDQKTFLVSEYIRYFGKKNCFLYTQNDWYKQFVTVISDEQLDEYGHTISFPKVELNIENINTALLNLDLISSRLESLHSLPAKGINPQLIKQILKADALGINFDPPSSIFPSSSESIHMKSHELRSVESFKYSPGGTCFPLKRMLNMEYDPYGPKENMQFPNWLQLLMQPGVIILSGTPQMQDMEEVLIRFYATQGYIYRSFTLRVQDQQGNSSRSQQISQKTKTKKQIEMQKIDDKSKLLQSDSSPIGTRQYPDGDDFGMDSSNAVFDKNQQIKHHHMQSPSLFGREASNTVATNFQTPYVPILANQIGEKQDLLKELDINN